MIIYIPLFYLCVESNCGFFQAESYTLNEQKCEQEVEKKLKELNKQDTKATGICVDVKINLEKKSDVTNSRIPPR